MEQLKVEKGEHFQRREKYLGYTCHTHTHTNSHKNTFFFTLPVDAAYIKLDLNCEIILY